MLAILPTILRRRNRALGLLLLFILSQACAIEIALAQAGSPALVLDGSIALPDTGGRIDHMAIDLARGHLFVAELGNGTLDVVDVNSRKVIHRISGLKEPQGIAYEPKSDLMVVASGGDGTLRSYSAMDFSPRNVLKLGDDADNVRIDPRNGHAIVGYGSGALAIVDLQAMRILREIPVAGHPESFRLSASRVFVNVPDAGQIVAADLDTTGTVTVWKPKFSSNFPMILDNSGNVGVVFRHPSKLVLFDAHSGAAIASADTCGDADDLYFDSGRKTFFVSCGAGAVDVIGTDKAGLHALSRIATPSGARTSLFVPELDRLFVAARSGMLGSAASILVFRID